MRVLNRPPEGHPLREMRQEELEAAMEIAENAVQQCAEEDALRLARRYARQVDTMAAELVARTLERELRDREADEQGGYPALENENYGDTHDAS